MLDGRWKLQFPDGVHAALEPVPIEGQPAAPVWANDLFKWSMHEKTDGERAPELFFYDKESQRSVFLKEIAEDMTPQVFRHSFVGKQFEAEMYVYRVPRAGCGLCKFFTVPWLQHFVFNDKCYSKWVSKHYKGWVAVLRTDSLKIIS